MLMQTGFKPAAPSNTDGAPFQTMVLSAILGPSSQRRHRWHNGAGRAPGPLASGRASAPMQPTPNLQINITFTDNFLNNKGGCVQPHKITFECRQPGRHVGQHGSKSGSPKVSVKLTHPSATRTLRSEAAGPRLRAGRPNSNGATRPPIESTMAGALACVRRATVPLLTKNTSFPAGANTPPLPPHTHTPPPRAHTHIHTALPPPHPPAPPPTYTHTPSPVPPSGAGWANRGECVPDL
jgi:hypothetical protein